MMQVSISKAQAAAQWGKNAPISADEGRFVVHIDQANPAGSVQKAARKIEGFGTESVELIGEGWDVETQWAFYTGFTSPMKLDAVKWNEASSEADLAELNARKTATTWAREVMNRCPEEIYPESLASKAIELIESVAPKGTVTAQTIVGDALADAGWVGVHGVGRGSDRPPVMLELDFNPTGDANAPISTVLVGKGITFDSGGYSLKPSVGMVAMKFDMGGAATVTSGLALAIQRGLNKRVKLILCCAENLVSGHAYKLGDILSYKNGVSVEVVNTDAEGRLVLADGLIRAGELEPEMIINAATLTGAAHVALGDHYNAVFALDNSMSEKALAAAKAENEGAWALPLEPFHQGMCPSSYATTANSRAQAGGGAGGASNAAGFLSRFVPNDGKGWVHLDLSAAYRDSGDGQFAAGATTVGVRTVARMLEDA